MNTKVMTVTPMMAAEFLSRVAPEKQRRLNERLVSTYAQTMRNGKWVLTHQGIAFDNAGNLCDGQHRMKAVADSGVTIQILVSSDIPEDQKGVFTFDAIDRGVQRKIGDQLNVRHGIKNANMVAASCRIIGIICLRNSVRATVENTLAIYEKFGDQIDFCFSEFNAMKGFKQAALMGSLAFCMRAMPKELAPFIESVAKGENIKTGDPAYTLRNFVLSGGCNKHGGVLGSGERQSAIAARHYVLGQKITLLNKTSSIGLDFFAEKQPRIVKEIRSILS